MLEINYGIIATVAAAAVARCYLKFVRGVEPKSVNMSGKVRSTTFLTLNASRRKKETWQRPGSESICHKDKSVFHHNGVSWAGQD